ncbi:FkbM family methyltransferase [Tolypothrix sp. VBCCA 56010]|uniref:FkbM family methyltransferase n=1 Tax=Tolypothrix sp. VBCCA 56010 TaxID=3137731 RepID=UPI003D7C9E9B
MYFERLKRFLARPDVKQNPAKALLKRLWWRLRWTLTDKPYVIQFTKNLKIGVPKTGSASLIYYQGYSELETADFIHHFLRPGMVVVDVGAHIGEYTLLAAEKVGTTGEVHAFEPQSHLFPILSNNVQMNQLSNVTLNCAAVSNAIGEIEFEVFDEPSVSSIRKQTQLSQDAKLVKVACTSLDTYWSNQQRQIDLIKVDVEGAEKMVFQGAEKILNQPSTKASTWLFEYSPKGYASFGYRPSDLLELLKRHDYKVWQYCGNGKITDFDPAASSITGIINLIAAKDKTYLLSLLQGENISISEYAQT